MIKGSNIILLIGIIFILIYLIYVLILDLIIYKKTTKRGQIENERFN